MNEEFPEVIDIITGSVFHPEELDSSPVTVDVNHRNPQYNKLIEGKGWLLKMKIY